MIDRLMNRRWAVTLFIAAVAFAATGNTAFAQAPASAPGKVIIDTDIGDDIDDVYALSLALSSPEFQILGITSAWGDTALRSRLLDRLLCVTGREEIPVYTGIDTTSRHKAGASAFSQAPWASAGKQRPYIAGDAIPFLLDQIRRNPGEVTLIAIGPLTNIGAAIDRDPATFRKLKRVVLMGGSVAHGYGPSNGASGPPPEPEYNIAMDPDAAQKLFQSGVPIVMLPLDSTQIKFEDAKRSSLASISTPLTDSLQVLTAEWSRTTGMTAPTLFDPVAVAYALDARSCPATPVHIEIDARGLTRQTPGPPNAEACLTPHPDLFFPLLLPRLLSQRMVGTHACLAAPRP